MTIKVDPNTLTDKQIEDAIVEHCRRMGSALYFYGDEIARWKEDRAGIRVYRDAEDKPLRAYYVRKQDRTP